MTAIEEPSIVRSSDPCLWMRLNQPVSFVVIAGVLVVLLGEIRVHVMKRSVKENGHGPIAVYISIDCREKRLVVSGLAKMGLLVRHT